MFRHLGFHRSIPAGGPTGDRLQMRLERNRFLAALFLAALCKNGQVPESTCPISWYRP